MRQGEAAWQECDGEGRKPGQEWAKAGELPVGIELPAAGLKSWGFFKTKIEKCYV